MSSPQPETLNKASQMLCFVMRHPEKLLRLVLQSKFESKDEWKRILWLKIAKTWFNTTSTRQSNKLESTQIPLAFSLNIRFCVGFWHVLFIKLYAPRITFVEEKGSVEKQVSRHFLFNLCGIYPYVCSI